MAKIKSSYFCQSCGYNSPKWIGKCPSCNEWNTFVEEVVQKDVPQKGSWKTDSDKKLANKPLRVADIAIDTTARIVTSDAELNRVLGGGIVPGSLILLGGEPGIGKSTLLLQLSISLAGKKVLYVSGEESESQIKMRAERISKENQDCYILAETNTQNIFKQIEQLAPDVVIIDSIQTLHSTYIESVAGSVSQVRECAAEMLKFAKETAVPVFLVGHITKDGSIAGPKVLLKTDLALLRNLEFMKCWAMVYAK